MQKNPRKESSGNIIRNSRKFYQRKKMETQINYIFKIDHDHETYFIDHEPLISSVRRRR
jgi:hypothetical protein